MQQWHYFTTKSVKSVKEGVILVDEDGIPLQENGKTKVFASVSEADEYLLVQNIRGTIR